MLLNHFLLEKSEKLLFCLPYSCTLYLGRKKEILTLIKICDCLFTITSTLRKLDRSKSSGFYIGLKAQSSAVIFYFTLRTKNDFASTTLKSPLTSFVNESNPQNLAVVFLGQFPEMQGSCLSKTLITGFALRMFQRRQL